MLLKDKMIIIYINGHITNDLNFYISYISYKNEVDD